MKNIVRFFINKEERCKTQYEDIPIPQLKTTVFIDNEMYIVNDITYDFDDEGSEFNLIDVSVTTREDELFD